MQDIDTKWKVISDVVLNVKQVLNPIKRQIELELSDENKEHLIVHIIFADEGVFVIADDLKCIKENNSYEFFSNNVLYSLFFDLSNFKIYLKVLPYKLHTNKNHPVFGDTSKKDPDVVGQGVCWFCNKSGMTFEKEAHILPAGLGNRTFISKKCECDSCNSLISKYESHLVNLLDMDRAFISGSRRPGRKQTNVIKNKSATFQSSAGSKELLINLKNNVFDVEIDESGGGVGYFKYESDGYNLENVCKSLTHSVWLYLSEDTRKSLDHIRKWLLNEVSIITLFLDEVIIQGGNEEIVTLEIWESNNDETKNSPLVIRYYYANRLLQFYLPAKNTITEPLEFEKFNYGMLPLTNPSSKLVPKRYEITNMNKMIPREKKVYFFKFDSHVIDSGIEKYKNIEIEYIFPESELNKLHS